MNRGTAAEQDWLSGARMILPASASVGMFVYLASRSHPEFNDVDFGRMLGSLMIVSFICAAAVTGYVVRSLLLPSASSGSVAGPEGRYRDRLALYIVGIGTTGIAGVALVLIAEISRQQNNHVETVGVNVFSSILPVFATWVGTVLAFYFTKESFRQATESAQTTLQTPAAESITRAGTMVSFDRIIRYEMQSADIDKGETPQAAAARLTWDNFKSLFNPPGVMRIIVFDDKKIPVFVLRHDAIPGIKETDRLQVYLDHGDNKAASVNFALAAASATIADGRRILELRKVTDLFVTEHGKANERIIGWVPDDNLRSGPQA